MNNNNTSLTDFYNNDSNNNNLNNVNKNINNSNNTNNINNEYDINNIINNISHNNDLNNINENTQENTNNDNINNNKINKPKKDIKTSKLKQIIIIIIGVIIIVTVNLLFITRCTNYGSLIKKNGYNGYTEKGNTLRVHEMSGVFNLSIESIEKYKNIKDPLYKGEFIKVKVSIDNKEVDFSGIIINFSLVDENKKKVANGVVFSSFPDAIQDLKIKENTKGTATIYFYEKQNSTTEQYTLSQDIMDKIKYLKVSVISHINSEKYNKEGVIDSTYENYYLTIKK